MGRFVESNFFSTIVIQVIQDEGFGVAHIEVHILSFEEEGFKNFWEVNVVSVFAKSLQFYTLKLIHVGKDHNQVFAH